jgi:protein TonB
MGRTLFEDLVVSARKGRPATRTLALPASAGIHVVAALSVAVVALQVPRPSLAPPIHGPLPPFVPEVRVRVAAATRPAGARPPRRGRLLSSPDRPIEGPAREPDVTPGPEEVTVLEPTSEGPGSGGGGQGIGDPGRDPHGDPEARDGAGGPAGEAPVVPGGEVDPPRLLRSVKPPYPDIARQVRLQAEVELQCLIDTDGRVTGVTVVHGHPLFNRPAVEAVQQWLYTPTRLNGVPVRVLLTVKVKFILQ